MSIWDYVIFGLVAMQCVVLLALVLAVLRVKNGAILKTVQRVMGIATAQLTHVEPFLRGARRYGRRVNRIRADIRRTGRSTRAEYRRIATMLEPVAGLIVLMAQVRSAQRMVGAGIRAFRALSGTSSTPRSSTSSLSLAERMGLVPPIARQLRRAVPSVRIAWDVYTELKRRGLMR